MKEKKKWVKVLLATIVCVVLLPCMALADVDKPYEEQPEKNLELEEETLSGTVSAQFPDVPEDAKYAQATISLAEMGIITGDERGNFNPNDTITRAEMAAIICRVMGVEESAKSLRNSKFVDVNTNHWAVSYVAKATETGVINGYGDGNFGPADFVTYEQIIKMLVCAWGYESVAQIEGGWPDGYVKTAKEIGIITSDCQEGNTSVLVPRWEAAQLLYNTTMLPTNYEGGSVDENL